MGIRAEPRPIPIHQRLHDANRDRRRYRLRAGELSAGVARGAAAAGGIAAHEPAPVVCQRVRAGYLAALAAHHTESWAALRVHEPAARYFERLGRTLRFTLDAYRIYWRANGHTSGIAVYQQEAFRAAIRHCAPGAQERPGLPRRLRHLLHAHRYEYVVQHAPQCSHHLLGDEPERCLRALDHEFQFRSGRAGDYGHQLHGIRPVPEAAVRFAVERSRGEEPGRRDDDRDRLPGRARISSAALAPDQQCAAGPRAGAAPASLSKRHFHAGHGFPAERNGVESRPSVSAR